jgi:protein-S-isoprenylcysteine O-methyltransferase Ste14
MSEAQQKPQAPQISCGCISPLFVVFVVFLVLRGTGTVTWSWWWVTLPLWIIPGAILAAVLAGVAGWAFAFSLDRVWNDIRNANRRAKKKWPNWWPL